MFPQVSTLSLALRDTPPETQRTLNQLLSQDKPIDAKVLRTAAEPSGGAGARVTLEVNGKTVQLITQQPLQSGDQLKISLTGDGKILLQSPTTSSPASAGNTLLQAATAQPSASLPQTAAPSNTQTTTTGQAQTPAAAQVISLKAGSELIPINKGTTIEGTVLKSTPLNQPAATAANAATNTNSNATYARPLPSPSQPMTASTTSTTTSVPTATVTAPTNQTPQGGTQALNSAPLSAPPPSTAATAQVANNITNGQPSTAPQAAPTTSTSGPPSQTGATPPAPSPTPQSPPAQQTQATSFQVNTRTGVPQRTTPASVASTPTTHSTSTTMAPTGSPLTTNASAQASNPSLLSAAPTNQPSAGVTTANAGFNIDIRLTSGLTTTLQSNTPLQPNTPLLITRDTQGQISANIQPLPANTDALQREQGAIQDALRNALPNQQPIGDMLAQLQNTAGQAQTAKPEVSGIVRTMLQLFGVRPGNPEAPQTLQRNVQSGGMQTEFNLASGKLPEKNDLKGLLRQLQQTSADLPIEQRQRIEQLIQNMQSRITHNQVSSLQQWKEAPDGSFERVIQLDIPIVGNNRTDNLELRISHEHKGGTDNELSTLWRARLHFDLEEFGAIDAEIKLTGDEQIQVQFWCDEKATQRHIQKQLQDFGELLQEKGFTEAELKCFHGHSPNREGDLIQKHLVDIHT